MFTKEEMENTKVTKEKDDKYFNEMMDQVPLIPIDAKPELDYYLNPKPSMADHIQFLQALINNSRILMKSKSTAKKAERLFRQGFLFRHQRKAIEAKATRYSRTEEKWKKEMEKCSSCGEDHHT